MKDRLWFFVAAARAQPHHPGSLSPASPHRRTANDPLRGQAHRQRSTRPQPAGLLHRQPGPNDRNDLGRADRARPGHDLGTAASPERAVRGQLHRHPHLQPVRRGPVLGEGVHLRSTSAAPSRDIHDSPMRGVGADRRPATSTRPTSTPPTPRTATTTSSTARLSYFLDEAWAPTTSRPATRTSPHPHGGNTQSATDFVFLTDFKAAGGSPVLDANG